MDSDNANNYDSEEEMINVASAVCAIASVITSVAATLYYNNYIDKGPREKTYFTKRKFIKKVVSSDEHCYNLLRMNVNCFHRFVDEFRRRGSLENTIHCTIEEQVAIFFNILAHNERIRNLKAYAKRSGETVGRYFNKVLEAVIEMDDNFIKPPTLEIPTYINENQRFMPYFKDCIGAIDGTHIPAKVVPEYEPRFRGRKHRPTQNILAACDFDLKFTYVIMGWEGSASDSRILIYALK